MTSLTNDLRALGIEPGEVLLAHSSPSGEAFGREPGLETTGAVAVASARLFSQRAVVDFGARWLEANRRPGA